MGKSIYLTTINRFIKRLVQKKPSRPLAKKQRACTQNNTCACARNRARAREAPTCIIKSSVLARRNRTRRTTKKSERARENKYCRWVSYTPVLQTYILDEFLVHPSKTFRWLKDTYWLVFCRFLWSYPGLFLQGLR